MPGLRARGALQQHQFGQFAGVLERAPLQQLWRTHRQHFFTEQLDAGRARPGALAKEEHHVGGRLQQGEGFHFVADVEVDVRVLLAEALEVRNQPAHAKARLSGYLEDFGLFAVGHDVTAGHIDLGENLVDLGQVQRACWCQLQAPTDAQKQMMAEHLFKLGHLLAHCALGQVQLLGGAGEAQVPGGSLETLQGGHRWHQTFGHSGL